MRRTLDLMYRLSGGLAAFFLAMIGVTILTQVAARLFKFTFDATEVSGFCMAASLFLGHAYTFNTGSHIRVNLLISRLGLGGKRWIEIWGCTLGVLGGAYFAWHAWEMTIESFQFGDTSPGLMAVPFWIPQVGMSLGITMLAIGFADALVQVLGGRVPDFADAEAQAIGDELAAASAEMAAAGVAKGA